MLTDSLLNLSVLYDLYRPLYIFSIEKLPVGVSTYARSALAPRLARSFPFVQPGVFRSYLSTEHISLNYLLFLSLDSTVDSSVPEGTVKFIIQT